MIERYTEEKRRDAGKEQDGKGGGDEGGDKEAAGVVFDSLLQQIGIANPVTKTTAGSRYREELARQLADFLAGPLQNGGGGCMDRVWVHGPCVGVKVRTVCVCDRATRRTAGWSHRKVHC